MAGLIGRVRQRLGGPRQGPLRLALTLAERLAEHAAVTSVGRDNRFLDKVSVTGQGRFGARIAVGDESDLRGLWVIHEPDATITIGSRSELNAGCTLEVLEAVEIGDDVLIGAETYISDNDSHSADWNERRHDHMARRRGARDWSVVPRAPVRIADKAWIGRRVTILKGVEIGEGAIVATGSVVTQPVEPWTLVAGVPARRVRDVPRP
jgi:acetyltransferase-like isoleucine patch superfamily enzyme